MPSTGPTVVKIGGSTLGAEDTTLKDVVALQREGAKPIVVHGGGAMINEWLDKMQVESQFVDGLRSTSATSRALITPRSTATTRARAVSASSVARALPSSLTPLTPSRRGLCHSQCMRAYTSTGSSGAATRCCRHG